MVMENSYCMYTGRGKRLAAAILEYVDRTEVFFSFFLFLEAQKRNNAFLEGGLDPDLMSEIQSRRGSELHISVVIKANNEQVQQQRRTA